MGSGALSDPFVRRLVLAATLTAAGIGVAPLVSDVGVRSADSVGTLVGLTLSLFGVAYLAVLAASFLWAVLVRDAVSSSRARRD